MWSHLEFHLSISLSLVVSRGPAAPLSVDARDSNPWECEAPVDIMSTFSFLYGDVQHAENICAANISTTVYHHSFPPVSLSHTCMNCNVYKAESGVQSGQLVNWKWQTVAVLVTLSPLQWNCNSHISRFRREDPHYSVSPLPPVCNMVWKHIVVSNPC